MKKLGFTFLIFLIGMLSINANAQTILFQDNFNDGNNDGWTTTMGGWTVISGHNEATTTTPSPGGGIGQFAYTYAGDPSWTDYTLDVDVTFGTNVTEFYVGVRVDVNTVLYPDRGNKYVVAIGAHDDRAKLRYNTETEFVNLERKSYPINAQTTYHIQVTIEGNHITAFIDGNPLFDYTFSGSIPIYSSGVIGIGYKSNEGPDGAYFDNVLVTAIGEEPEPCTIDIHPDTLNLKSKGRYVTCYIELPEQYYVGDIDITTVALTINSNPIPVELSPTEIGDYNNNSVLDLMVKFDREAVQGLCTPGAVDMAIYCEDFQGNTFLGEDTVLVIDKGRGHSSMDANSVVY
jgi:hypothetical protein